MKTEDRIFNCTFYHTVASYINIFLVWWGRYYGIKKHDSRGWGCWLAYPTSPSPLPITLSISGNTTECLLNYYTYLCTVLLICWSPKYTRSNSSKLYHTVFSHFVEWRLTSASLYRLQTRWSNSCRQNVWDDSDNRSSVVRKFNSLPRHMKGEKMALLACLGFSIMGRVLGVFKVLDETLNQAC